MRTVKIRASNRIVKWCLVVIVDMAYALVECEEEGSITVIPSSWIVKPDRIQEDVDFPINALCYWKRKGNKFDAIILDISGK